MAEKIKSNRFGHIDVMRAFAVMLVVVSHAGVTIIPGNSGVTIFFAISGFVITYHLLKERDRTGTFAVGGFYLRRVIKLAPAFIVAIAIPSLLWSLWHELNWPAFISQVLFTFNWVNLAGLAQGVLPGSPVMWSLAIEEQFYIAFALVWLLAVRQRRWKEIVVGSAILAILYSTVARVVIGGQSDRIYFGTDTRLDGIAWGILTAMIFHRWLALGSPRNRFTTVIGSDWAIFAAVLLYLASVGLRDEIFRDTARYTMQSMAACVVILYGFMSGPGLISKCFARIANVRALNFLGLASYAIYLAHAVLMHFIEPYLETPLWIDVPILVILGTLSGIAVYVFVEVPVAARLRASLDVRRGRLSPAR
jgi:peptidoglycan/LPS O-acetylase OafA/YrhL